MKNKSQKRIKVSFMIYSDLWVAIRFFIPKNKIDDFVNDAIEKALLNYKKTKKEGHIQLLKDYGKKR